MKNANDMTLEAQQIFEQLKTGELDRKTAKEMNNAIGKMIGLSRNQIEYAKLTNKEPNIPFLEAGETK